MNDLAMLNMHATVRRQAYASVGARPLDPLVQRASPNVGAIPTIPRHPLNPPQPYQHVPSIPHHYEAVARPSSLPLQLSSPYPTPISSHPSLASPSLFIQSYHYPTYRHLQPGTYGPVSQPGSAWQWQPRRASTHGMGDVLHRRGSTATVERLHPEAESIGQGRPGQWSGAPRSTIRPTLPPIRTFFPPNHHTQPSASSLQYPYHQPYNIQPQPQQPSPTPSQSSSVEERAPKRQRRSVSV